MEEGTLLTLGLYVRGLVGSWLNVYHTQTMMKHFGQMKTMIYSHFILFFSNTGSIIILNVFF